MREKCYKLRNYRSLVEYLTRNDYSMIFNDDDLFLLLVLLFVFVKANKHEINYTQSLITRGTFDLGEK